MVNEPEDDLQDAISLRPDGKFRFQSGVHRRLEELDDARIALIGLGIDFTDLRQAKPGDDPPDCTCRVNGELWGVEVTEIIHPQVMQERVKGDHGLHHEWTDDEIVAASEERIAKKDNARPKDGRYSRYLLVIRTEEMHMEPGRMEPLLRYYEARCRLITDACLAYSYHLTVTAPHSPVTPSFQSKSRGYLKRSGRNSSQ
jgi:hypothetical protein